MLWRAVGFLLVTLQRQNFQVLAGCYDDLPDDVQGRLGRPLSEEPEFWRAAPEEALQWGAEEFGFPLPTTGGDTSSPAPAAEGSSLGAAAEGHLCAALGVSLVVLCLICVYPIIYVFFMSRNIQILSSGDAVANPARERGCARSPWDSPFQRLVFVPLWPFSFLPSLPFPLLAFAGRSAQALLCLSPRGLRPSAPPLCSGPSSIPAPPP
jgi:hypothetical protein